MSEQRIVAQFEIPYRACLDGDGAALGTLPAWVEDGELLRRMYRMMVRARAFEVERVEAPFGELRRRRLERARSRGRGAR